MSTDRMGSRLQWGLRDSGVILSCAYKEEAGQETPCSSAQRILLSMNGHLFLSVCATENCEIGFTFHILV